MTEQEAIKYLEQHAYIDDAVKDMCIKAMKKQISKEISVAPIKAHADPTTMFVKPDRTEKGEEDMSSKTTQFWGVVTSNKEKADKVFDEIEKEYRGRIVKKVFTPDFLHEKRFTQFEDGNVLAWVIPSLGIRGYRYHRIWLDKDITDKEILNCVIYPKLYCKEDDVIWI